MIPLLKIEEELIDEVLEQFNFGKCKSVMEHLRWGWGLFNNNRVPTIQEMKESARDRINNAIKGIKEDKKHSYREAYISSSGGLKASVWKNRYGRICDVQLEFVLTDWSTF
jgi:hypothetical protein